MNFSWFGGKSSSNTTEDTFEIYALAVSKDGFVATDVQNLYTRILTDVLERTQGIPEEKQALLWDNCIASESHDGLVTLLAKAMTDKADLFLVWEPALKLIRKATSVEQQTIRNDYEKQGKSGAGVFITFKNYTRTDMVKLYSALEYCAINGLYKSMSLSTAIQLKMKDLRGSVSLADAGDVRAQAKNLAAGLKAGRDVLTDAEDTIETAKPDLTATTSATDFIAQKRSLYLGLPASWITGEAKNSMGDTGEGDARAVERGLKNYYFAVVQPVLDVLLDVKTTFKSENFRLVASALEALKTFDITSDDHLSKENKTLVINELFGLDEDETGDEPAEVQPPAAQPNPPPASVPPAAAAG